MITVKAKFKCFHIEDQSDCCQKIVSFSPVTTIGCDENKSFARYTPAGLLQLTISDDTPASDAFKKGKEYYLTIEPAF